MELSTPVFPFTAIVGQEQMKQALVLSLINPDIGGVLVRGERGTGKSTAVRALASLLPPISVVADCSFGYGRQIARAMGAHYLLAEEMVKRGVIELPL